SGNKANIVCSDVNILLYCFRNDRTTRAFFWTRYCNTLIFFIIYIITIRERKTATLVQGNTSISRTLIFSIIYPILITIRNWTYLVTGKTRDGRTFIFFIIYPVFISIRNRTSLIFS